MGGTESKSDAVESLLREKAQKEEAESDLEEGLEETFPASDPPAATNPSRPGVPIGEA